MQTAVRRNWQRTHRERGQAWAYMYVSMRPKGQIMLGRKVFEMMGEPAAVYVLFDPANGTIGLQPTNPRNPDAFHVGIENKKTGQRRVHAYKMLVEFGLTIPETVRFQNVQIDKDGILILDLRTARVEKRVTNHRDNKKRDGE